jgi:4-amino-4-deoxy-L-arabinose transferase-like glycosyltransferase
VPVPLVPAGRAAAARASAMYTAIALLVPAFFFLYGLDAFPLRDNNEGLYAGIARDMLASGRYIVPHLNGVPYIEKPPLLYWLMSLSMWLLGPTPAAARLVPAGSMLALCACLFQFCRLHRNIRAGCYASVGLASAVPVALIAHVVLFDALLTALLGASLLCYLHSYLARSRRALLLAAFLLALAVLVKGGIALVLAAGVVGLFLLLMRERAGWRRLLDPGAAAVLLAAAAPWHLLATLEQDGFAWFYFINEHVLRFLGQRQPDDYHRGPLWFYLPRLFGMLLPWTAFLLLLVRRRATADSANRVIVRFCQAAVLFPFAFFSLSQAKAEYYLLVVAPPLALWLAIELAPRLRRGGDRRLALCCGLAFACALLALLAVPGARTRNWTLPAVALSALVWLALAVAGTGGFARLRSLRSRELALLAVALIAAPVLGVLCHAAAKSSARDSSVHLARILQQQPQPGRAVFLYRDFEDVFATLPFYLGHPVPVIDSASRDLQFGCTLEPGTACVSAAHFRRLQARVPVAVAVRADRAAAFRAMAGAHGWRTLAVGDKMLFFNDR